MKINEISGLFSFISTFNIETKLIFSFIMAALERKDIIKAQRV